MVVSHKSFRIAINIYLLGGIFPYGFSTVFYILVLSKVNLSVNYPVVVG